MRFDKLIDVVTSISLLNHIYCGTDVRDVQ